MTTAGGVLVIGLDGATWTVLDPWIEDGTLPNLARIRSSGRWAPLASTIPPLTPPAWTTFLTGKNPGKHGVFHFADAAEQRADLAAGTPDLVDSRSIRSSTLWDILGHHGRKLVTINVPMSFPARPVNGVMVTCLLTPPDAPAFTYPPELSAMLPDYRIDLDRFIGEKPFAVDADGTRRKRVVEPTVDLAREFREIEEIRGRTALELLRSEPWDVFAVVFTAPDRMGHYLWPYHFRGGPDDPAEHVALYDAIRDVYVAMDTAIGALVDAAGADRDVIVLSDHGMGPAHRKHAHWNTWLYRRGDVVLDGASARTADGWLLRLGLPRDRIGRAVRRIPGLRSSGAVTRARASSTAAIDHERSTAYYQRIFDPIGGIRINAHGQKRDAIRSGLKAELVRITDPETGRPVVQAALDREEVYEGPYASQMPDLILVMDPAYGSSDRLSSYSAIVTDRPSVDDPGAHRMDGILAMSGPSVEPRAEPLSGIAIADIAPTILHLLGLPIPEDLDGHIVLDALHPWLREPGRRRVSPPVGLWPSGDAADDSVAIPRGDDPAVRERLRALGYVE